MSVIATPPVSELSTRLEAARAALGQHDLAGLVVSPGADLRYLCGYDAIALERLTALVLRRGGPVLVVPRLELPAALVSPVGELGLDVVAWDETDDPFALVADLLAPDIRDGGGRVGVEVRMWAGKAFALAARGLPVESGERLLADLRIIKSSFEIAALREAGAAIDDVHAQVPGLLRVGRTEREVAADISRLIVATGHVQVDFVIVASGPNGASPHHAVSDRALQPGDLIVVDIGGTMPSGYCSDSTRTYAIGEPAPDEGHAYETLRLAQELAVGHVEPGRPAAAIDEAARSVLDAAGFGEFFVHRTGHGIGLETHEEPYLVSGAATLLAPGMVFSVEPGVYLPGRFGARIEDIVVCTVGGHERLNLAPRDLVVVPA